jgi:hypothetical protein
LITIKTEKRSWSCGFGDARRFISDAGFDIEIYKTSKPVAELGAALPVQRVLFWHQ